MNALATDWFPEANRLVVALTPDVAGRVPPDRIAAGRRGRSRFGQSRDRLCRRRRRAGVDGTSAGERPHRQDRRSKGDVTEWTLSNGATVALLPTTLKADQILFRATAPGGTSLASDADFFSARVADDVIPAGGVGAFSRVVIDKLVNGKSLAVQPFISEIREGMRGGSAPRDLETMFQLIYLRFTAPRADPTAFAAMKARALALLADQSASPDVLFNQTLVSALSENNPRRQPETSASVAKWNLDTSLAFYKARFADASNFTFVFVGSFTLEAMRPLIETYIASLPATHAHETWRDQGVRPPAGVVQTTVRKGIAPKSEVAIVFSGPFEFTPQGRLALQTATLLLQGALERHDPRATRRHLRDLRRIGDQPISAARVSDHDPVDLRSCPGREPRAARAPGSGRRARHAVDRRSNDTYPRLPAARARSEQPGQRVSAGPDFATL